MTDVPPRARRQSPGGAGQDLLRGVVGDVGGGSRAVEVDGRHPVVVRDARRQAFVAIGGDRVPGIALQGGVGPSGAGVRRHLDPISGDPGAAVRGRRVPLQFDRVGADDRRRQVTRRAGQSGGRAIGDVSHGPFEAEHTIADKVPERVGAGVAIEHRNRIVLLDRAVQTQEHLGRGHIDTGCGLAAEHTSPEVGNGKVAGGRDGALIQTFVKDDDDLVPVDLRVDDFRPLRVHGDVARIPTGGFPRGRSSPPRPRGYGRSQGHHSPAASSA